jgi:hypothetical protein
MGFWGVLLELARAVVPHAAPHVARAVVDAAKERRAASAAGNSRSVDQPSNESLAEAISYLERRLSVVEEKASELEEKFLAAEARMAKRWEDARKLAIGVIAWNAVVTALLIAIVIYALLRH